MTPREDDRPADDAGERDLARQAEQATRRLQAGAPADLGHDPSRAGPILDLLPTLRDLADLGRRLARDRRAGGRRMMDPTDDASRPPKNPEEDDR